MKEVVTKVIDTLTQEDFHRALAIGMFVVIGEEMYSCAHVLFPH